MAGETHVVDPNVELMDEDYLVTVGPFGTSTGVLFAGTLAEVVPLGVWFDRETVVDSISVITDTAADDDLTFDVRYAENGVTGALAGNARKIGAAKNLKDVTAGTESAFTIDTTKNVVPAGSRLFLVCTAVGGSFTTVGPFIIKVRARTKKIG